MMIDVSIATFYSGVYFDYFLSFSVFFFCLFPFNCKKMMILYLFVLVLIFDIDIHIFYIDIDIFKCRHCQLYDCRLAI